MNGIYGVTRSKAYHFVRLLPENLFHNWVHNRVNLRSDVDLVDFTLLQFSRGGDGWVAAHEIVSTK